MTMREGIAWGVGLLGVAVAALGWNTEPRIFFFAWLAALAIWLAWPLGSMALLLVHRLTGGKWGDAMRPGLLVGTATLPLLLPAIAPVLLGLPSLYAWARPEDASRLANTFYLNVPFFLVRGTIYLLVWFGLAGLTVFGSPRNARVAAAGLPLLALTFTFAVIDLTMSLDPSFNSSIYGLLEGTAAVLFALSVAAIPASLTASRDALADIGKLLLALVVLWAYLDFMQFVIVWESNLSHDAGWYVRRAEGGWGGVFAAIALLHFLLPFVLLTLPRIQRSRSGIAGTAALLTAMQVVRGWWTVLPAAPRAISWIDIGCVLAFAGCAAGLAQAAGRTRLARRDV